MKYFQLFMTSEESVTRPCCCLIFGIKCKINTEKFYCRKQVFFIAFLKIYIKYTKCSYRLYPEREIQRHFSWSASCIIGTLFSSQLFRQTVFPSKRKKFRLGELFAVLIVTEEEIETIGSSKVEIGIILPDSKLPRFLLILRSMPMSSL